MFSLDRTRGRTMKRTLVLGMLALAVVVMTGCLAGPNEMANSPDEERGVAGFWKGLWHGIISPITFIVSLFTDSVHFYEVHNNGNWYNLGFVLGAGILFGGSCGAGRRARRRRPD